MAMISNEYAVNMTVHSDGVITANSLDIRGLVLEAEDMREMFHAILHVGSELLKLNHGLTDEELDDVAIVASVSQSGRSCDADLEGPAAPGATRHHPRVLFEDRGGLLDAVNA